MHVSQEPDQHTHEEHYIGHQYADRVDQGPAKTQDDTGPQNCIDRQFHLYLCMREPSSSKGIGQGRTVVKPSHGQA